MQPEGIITLPGKLCRLPLIAMNDSAELKLELQKLQSCQ